MEKWNIHWIVNIRKSKEKRENHKQIFECWQKDFLDFLFFSYLAHVFLMWIMRVESEAREKHIKKLQIQNSPSNNKTFFFLFPYISQLKFK